MDRYQTKQGHDIHGIVVLTVDLSCLLLCPSGGTRRLRGHRRNCRDGTCWGRDAEMCQTVSGGLNTHSDREWQHRDQDWDKHVAGPMITNTPGLPMFTGGKKHRKGKAESGDLELC